MTDKSEETAKKVDQVVLQGSEEKKEQADDAEGLDDLLDSALEDFGKPAPIPPQASSSKPEDKSTKKDPSKETEAASSEDVLPPSQEALFNEFFNNEAAMGAAADFQNALGDLMSELGKEFSQDPQFNDELSRLLQTTIPPGAMPQPSASSTTTATTTTTSSSTAPSGSTTSSSNAASASGGSEDDIAKTLGETLNRLSQNAQELQQEGGMTEDFMKMFEGMNMGSSDGGDAALLPMMQSMMQNLLAKEVLYPSLKEVVGKYPDWLSEKKETIPQADYDRYSNQLGIMQKLCSEYEAETDSDSAETKQQRTMRIMELIQQMESLGQPPADIVGDMGPGMQFDEEGNPRIPGMFPGMMPGMPPGMPNPEQCSIM